jgi:hypothetical protein
MSILVEHYLSISVSMQPFRLFCPTIFFCKDCMPFNCRCSDNREAGDNGTKKIDGLSVGKNVSFASPIATVLGGHNSSVMCEERQNSVARVGSAASPPTMLEVDGSISSANTAAPEPSLLPSELVQHFDQPLSKGKIEAIKNLLENGKQLKRKVRGTKVAPAVLACPSALV